MAKIPKNPEEIFPELTQDYRNIFGEDLISIILYGSGAGADYVHGKSDLNLLITLTERGMEGFDRALETVGRWRKRNVAIPLFMTKEYLAGSQDAYPIEFLSMKRLYRVVTGEDVLAPLTFDQRNIRLQLERELRSKLLHMRGGYLATQGKTGKIRDLIGISLTAVVSLFGAILSLKNMDIPQGNRDIIMVGGKAAGIDATVFLKCAQIRSNTDHFSSDEVRAIFRDYLKEIGHLCERIDKMDA